MEPNDIESHLALELALDKVVDGVCSSDDESGPEDNASESGKGSQAESPRLANIVHYVDPVEEQIRLLKKVLADPQGHQCFSRYLKQHCSNSNLRFWLACESYKKTPPHEQGRLKDSARAVYQNFISRSAPFKIDLTAPTLQAIKVGLRFGSPPGVSFYDKAQSEVITSMAQNEFARFCSSDTISEVSAPGTAVSVSDCTATDPVVRYPRVPSKASSDISDNSSAYTVDSDTSIYSGFTPRRNPRTILNKPVSTGTGRSAISDAEALNLPSSAMVRHSSRVASQEEFVAQVTERLLAVEKDRVQLKREVLDAASRNGTSQLEDLDWYDHPRIRKYTVHDEVPIFSIDTDTSSYSEVSEQVAPVVQCNTLKTPQWNLDNAAQAELLLAMKEMHVRNKHKQQSSSKYSTVVSDSGISIEAGYHDGMVHSSTTNNRIQQFVKTQQEREDREQQAIQAATLLMTNSPINNQIIPGHIREGPLKRHTNSEPWIMTSSGKDKALQAAHFPPNSYPVSEDSSSTYSSEFFIPRPKEHYDSDCARPITLIRHPKTSKVHLSRQKGSTRQSNLTQRPIDNKTVLVLYTMDDESIPYSSNIADQELTLGEFKEKVFRRKGDYRFFFLNWCEDIQSEVHQECLSEDDIIPRHRGRITGKIVTC